MTAVKPRKAAVRVDGEVVGQARDYNGKWDRLWLEPGRHEIEFSHPGHLTLRLSVRVRKGGVAYISERLHKGEGVDPRSNPPVEESAEPRVEPRVEPRPAPSSLRRGLLRLVVHPPDAAIYLDGEFLANAAELSRLHGALPMAAGPHTLEVVRPGFIAETREIEVSERGTLRIEVTLHTGD